MHDPAFHQLFLFRWGILLPNQAGLFVRNCAGDVAAGLQIPVFLTAVVAVRRMSATAWPGFDTGTHPAVGYNIPQITCVMTDELHTCSLFHSNHVT